MLPMRQNRRGNRCHRQPHHPRRSACPGTCTMQLIHWDRPYSGRPKKDPAFWAGLVACLCVEESLYRYCYSVEARYPTSYPSLHSGSVLSYFSHPVALLPLRLLPLMVRRRATLVPTSPVAGRRRHLMSGVPCNVTQGALYGGRL